VIDICEFTVENVTLLQFFSPQHSERIESLEDFIKGSRTGEAMAQSMEGSVWGALDQFKIELPSWGFANTGTRFGKFTQPAAATNLAEKFSDAGMVNQLTGACPTVALHVLWDLPHGLKDVPQVKQLSSKCGVAAGSINPNFFQEQEYKFNDSQAGARSYARLRSHRRPAQVARRSAMVS
jgi:L-rhamnose isomerase